MKKYQKLAHIRKQGKMYLINRLCFLSNRIVVNKIKNKIINRKRKLKNNQQKYEEVNIFDNITINYLITSIYKLFIKYLNINI